VLRLPQLHSSLPCAQCHALIMPVWYARSHTTVIWYVWYHIHVPYGGGVCGV
jgi:hypothetical protein